ncbi:DUF429 domain-containing protein [Halothiobacillus neapolitanus]|uniref:DUF429 domain-containing protein n=1 Tax=Halothiobacillus neapolitanus (strain ATCC 23641 / DSM 15147 / CIP 104769 / NCIMB 8539 / c2) TaxID=555778 RepID=D0L0B5_HALNC|nr:DUF429 domain-containing protein [Halothiobacillus neapolitanus]ACX96138.1 conserved hypothetical protein [Halothiobacillus neapolitanus c2]TDN66448.1 putative RNase H-like nuclease [Halothiobacillus neapolitanus]
MTLAGIDMAWITASHPTAIAFGELQNDQLTLIAIQPDLLGLSCIQNALESAPDLRGVAIDAPTIITNQYGARACERELARCYGGRKAGCHPTNRDRYPEADSVALSDWLAHRRHEHACQQATKWQIECYPHPALIEIFQLAERHLYKKGPVPARQQGQIELAQRLKSLAQSPKLALIVAGEWSHHFSAEYIQSLRGRSLKQNEDVLDAIICLYIAGLFARSEPGQLFGSVDLGYIYVPQCHCESRQ